MTTETLTLTDFLLARIAEDEAVAEFEHDETCYLDRHPDRGWCDCPRARRKRALAECEAKRRIVELWALDMSEPYDDEPAMPLGGQGAEVFYDVLRALALPYADHPDYRQEWRP